MIRMPLPGESWNCMEMPRSNHADKYYVIDFDRCLGSTGKLQTLLEQIVNEETSITHKELGQAHVEAITSGGSFDSVRFIEERLRASGDIEDWERIVKLFIHKAQQVDMCEPNARDLLDTLDQKDAPYGILTFGGLLWQTMKIEAARLEHVPYMITNTKEKSHVLTKWKQQDGTFRIPEELRIGGVAEANSLVLLDDKAISFKDMPEGVRGIQVLPYDGSELLLSQRGALPDHVVVVRGLAGAIELINSGNVW